MKLLDTARAMVAGGCSAAALLAVLEQDFARRAAETERKRKYAKPKAAVNVKLPSSDSQTTGNDRGRPDDWPPNYLEAFWTKYPNKVGKGDALKKLVIVRRSGTVTWAELWAGLERYVAKTDDRPWCNPATWINQQRWADQPAIGGQNGRHPQADRSVVAAADRILERMRGFDDPLGPDRR